MFGKLQSEYGWMSYGAERKNNHQAKTTLLPSQQQPFIEGSAESGFMCTVCAFRVVRSLGL